MATVNTSGGINRIVREIANIRKGQDVSLAVACQDEDVRRARALVIGPHGTPYEFGFFEFDIEFPDEYPIKSPIVTCTTTNSGRTRFNPNIYSNGRVCLSILGTWRGEPGEQWSSAQGLESILISIQSLMSTNPYENEPGFKDYGRETDEPTQYIAKIRHETIRISVIQRLERLLGLDHMLQRNSPSLSNGALPQHEAIYQPHPISPATSSSGTSGSATPVTAPLTVEKSAEAMPYVWNCDQWDPFDDLLKRRFLWYYDSYMKSVAEHSKDQRDGTTFKMMPFEYEENIMSGSFAYFTIRSSLERIRRALEVETASWGPRGVAEAKKGNTISGQLAFQFEQLQHKWNGGDYPGSRMEISLPDPKNPFTWQLMLFGCMDGELECGIFNMTLSIPPTFPDVQPRVKVNTPIYHRQVNSTGFLCYLPEKPHDISSHLEAIVATLDDAKPVYDPRLIINPQAFSMFWGGVEQRKQYARMVRKSAELSRHEVRLESRRLAKRASRFLEDMHHAETREREPTEDQWWTPYNCMSVPFSRMKHKKRTASGQWEDCVLLVPMARDYWKQKLASAVSEHERVSRAWRE